MTSGGLPLLLHDHPVATRLNTHEHLSRETSRKLSTANPAYTPPLLATSLLANKACARPPPPPPTTTSSHTCHTAAGRHHMPQCTRPAAARAVGPDWHSSSNLCPPVAPIAAPLTTSHVEGP
jgi:hypothetical protein